MAGLVVTVPVLLVGLLLVAYGTVARNRMGINLQPVTRPQCHPTEPRFTPMCDFKHSAEGC